MNKDLIDRRISQMEGKISNLKYNLSGQSSRDEFKKNINDLEELLEDLKSLIDRTTNPLRNG
jgi:hypothetical protein|tara:strand:- start:119 stop:304 length:186 start_codon:yes stop_codon:yes gene_type:complete